MSSDSQPPAPTERTGDAERIVKLALCVKAHPGITLAGIREALGREYGPQSGSDMATRRRFERDKETLRDYGVFIVADENAGYSIDEKASYAAPVDLTEAEASLLRMLCNALLEDPSYPFKNELRMILAKIGDDIDVPDLLPSMERPEDGSRKGRAARRSTGGLTKVRKAISQRKRLLFGYRDAQGNESARAVEPFGCFFLNKNCYVVAYDPDVQDERVFRLDRMSKMRVNSKAPGSPDFEARDFDASKYYGLPFQFGSEDYEARVRFDAENAWRAQRLCMGQGSLAEENGGITWTVRVRDTEALARWCVENGPGIVPEGPREAREAYGRGIASAVDALGALDADGEVAR